MNRNCIDDVSCVEERRHSLIYHYITGEKCAKSENVLCKSLTLAFFPLSCNKFKPSASCSKSESTLLLGLKVVVQLVRTYPELSSAYWISTWILMWLAKCVLSKYFKSLAAVAIEWTCRSQDETLSFCTVHTAIVLCVRSPHGWIEG